jgi:hypothetical protein
MTTQVKVEFVFSHSDMLSQGWEDVTRKFRLEHDGTIIDNQYGRAYYNAIVGKWELIEDES